MTGKKLIIEVKLTEKDGETSLEASQGLMGETTAAEMLTMIYAAHQTLNKSMKTALSL